MKRATDPDIQTLLSAWHESGRSDFERSYSNLHYDTYAPKVAHERRKYIALDRGTGGVYLVDRVTGEVYTIKAYGVPNRKVGTVQDLIDFYSNPTPDLATKRR